MNKYLGKYSTNRKRYFKSMLIYSLRKKGGDAYEEE